MVPANSHGISPVPHYSGYSYPTKYYEYAAVMLFGLPSQVVLLLFYLHIWVLQPSDGRNHRSLGFFPFARHYLGNHYCFLLLRVLRCFSSPGSLPCGYYTFSIVGFPIQTSADQILLANPRSFSQLITSFFVSKSLGIPHTPLSTFL